MIEALPSSTHAEVRRYIVASLRRELIGPTEDEEVIEESPLAHYLTGILYPKGQLADPSEDDSHSDQLSDEEADDRDILPSPSQSLRPSSIGLTCEVEWGTKAIRLEVSYGTYTEAESQKRIRWRRIPHKHMFDLDLSEGERILDLDAGAQIRYKVKNRSIRSSMVLTVFLVNANENPKDFVRACIFQPIITVNAIGDKKPFIHRRYELFPGTIDPEKESFEFLFRDRYEFAVGHCCSVDWEKPIGNRTGKIQTTFIPEYEVPRLDPEQLLEMEGLDMALLSETSLPGKMKRLLNKLPDHYEKWIISLEQETSSLPDSFKNVAQGHVNRCRDALRRIREGVDLVCSDLDAFEAFRFANKAMFLQLSRMRWIAEFRRTNRRGPEPRASVRWYPFQLAFILLNIKSIIDPKSDDRKIADLLWFPTGGGKTEAYLGLAAFVMAYRRLRARLKNTYGGGVTVIMRYTLRLLTIQQFQRAATLICACEVIRRSEPNRWGKEPFLVGLWIGQSATPNTFDEAKEALALEQANSSPIAATPIQLSYCPWCGERLRASDYWADNGRRWVLVSCPKNGCEFHGSKPEKTLPVLTVDEDIYHRCPSLIISTVDKFARIPWYFGAASIFGKVNRFCPRHGYLVPAEVHPRTHGEADGIQAAQVRELVGLPPPELIIQDELHLISGPLGTMVGLYESAIDYLCSRVDGDCIIPPKIVASTATIRRASEQIQQLFARRHTSQFPPPGLTMSDSFFAREVPLEESPGRLYVGVCAPGRSVKFALVWIYASLLQHGEFVRSRGDLIDPYWTLVGYFNSLRELGGALRLTEDDVPKMMGYIAGGNQPRRIRIVQELTSRRSSTSIPAILSELDQTVETGDSIDILLATNMLSVGVDIQRLGLMVVNGQPKTTSEYIQATNRVGRRFPGLIVTLYNWYRPRDMSHYERFVAYHSMLYRHIDAVSVTPFSPRARDRGLRALIVGMARILDAELMVNDGASRFNRSRPVIKKVEEVLRKRAETLLKVGEITNVQEEITNALDLWEDMVQKHAGRLVYIMPPYGNDKDFHPLLKHLGELEPDDAWEALDSLRNVERMANLFYRGLSA